MISAREAREQAAEPVREICDKTELDRIENAIKNAVRKGNNETLIGGAISDLAKRYLQRIGYEIHSEYRYNMEYFIILW